MALSIIPHLFPKTKVGSSVSTYSESNASGKSSSSQIKVHKISIFPPKETHTHLIVEKDLFSHTRDTYPIKSSDRMLYRNLQVREKECSGLELIVEDASTREPKVVIVRYIMPRGYRFHIYVTHPTHSRQEPIDRMNVKPKNRLYPLARVEENHSSSSSFLQVFDAENDSRTHAYTIQRTQSFPNCPRYVIKHQGKVVAWTCKDDEKSRRMVKVIAKTDASFMFCLVLIADEFTKQGLRNIQKNLDLCF
jgi:hypothetical protein